MKKICIYVLSLVFIQIALPSLSSEYLKTGKYMCELYWDYDGSQQERCNSKKGEQYDCIGYLVELKDSGLYIKRKGGDDFYKKISESNGGVFNEIHSMLFVDEFDDGSHGQILVSLNFVYNVPNIIHLKKYPNYAHTSWFNLTDEWIKRDPFRIKTFTRFSRCEYLD